MNRMAWLCSQRERIQELIDLCEKSLAVAPADSLGLIRQITEEFKLLRDGKKTDFDPLLRRARIDLDWDLPFFKPLGKFLEEMDKTS